MYTNGTIDIKNTGSKAWRKGPDAVVHLWCAHTPLMQMEKTFTETGTMILPKQVREYIKNKTGITYHITHVYRIMRGWKLETKVPQKIHASAYIIR
ncbi:MAG: hypothetical protein K8823_664 [Cenarchaeum symbiont of Oopsacas minuta]|nr:hypothetical protein [Cenarchaeum symbiont of Oopsacas minuta]